MGLVGSVASKYMIDIITGYQMSKLWIMVLITLGSAFFSLTIGNVIGRISTKLSIYINNDIQADIFDKIIDADWMEINKYSNGDVLNRFNSDVNTISGNAISWLPTIIIAVYDFVATFAVIWHYDKIMSLLAFASAPFMLLMSKFLISKQREYGKKVREMSSEMMTFEVETFYNFDTIKSFGISSLYGKKMRNWQEKFKDISLKYNMFTIKTNIVMSIIGMVVQYAAFGYCLFRLWTRDISYGTMTLFLQQRSNLNGAFNNLVSIIPNFLNSSISAHRIRELAQLKKEVHIPESSEMDAYVEDGFEVKMRDVDFSYIEGNRVITDSAFMANPGEIVALVGPSGEGKTTMIRLILGLIHPGKRRSIFKGFKWETGGDECRYQTFICLCTTGKYNSFWYDRRKFKDGETGCNRRRDDRGIEDFLCMGFRKEYGRNDLYQDRRARTRIFGRTGTKNCDCKGCFKGCTDLIVR